MLRTSLMPALAIVAIGAVALAVRPADTAAPKGGALPLGYVDIKRVFQEAPVAQSAVKEAEALKAQLQQELALMQDTLALGEAEQKELRELLDKKNPSDKDKARLAELRAQTNKLDEERRTLQQKPNPTDAEKARLQQLTQVFAKAETQLRSAMENRQSQLDKKGDELMDRLQDRILKSVEDVAREQGLSMVVDKQARLFGGTDITPQVVGKLKK